MIITFLIPILGLLLYANTLQASFHLDDVIYITDNFAIRDLGNVHAIWQFYPCRFLTFLSLAVNYHLGQLNVLGYHLFNIAVHILTALLVSWLTLLTLSTPSLQNNPLAKKAKPLALLAGLLFVSHPLAIEAVTYICQRAASMGAMFYLASLCFFIRFRMANMNISIYLASLLCAIAAMFTKENAITLPLMIVLYEYFFFAPKQKISWAPLLPFLLTLIIIPLTILWADPSRAHDVAKIASGPDGITPLHYFFTQLRVMITYIRLLFVPIHLNLDYDYPLYHSLFQWPVLASLMLLILIGVGVWRLRTRYPLLSFSIFWFFLTLLPESSLLPAKDLIFEHRLYLPLVGYCIFLVLSLYYLFSRKNLKYVLIITTFVLTANSSLTFHRNAVWKDELSLWSDTILKSPHKSRPYGNRGKYYYEHQELPLALLDFNKTLELDPHDALAYNDRGRVYFEQGQFDLALADYNHCLKINPHEAKAYNNRGIIDGREGKLNEALADFNSALKEDSFFYGAYINRGQAYYLLGNFNLAIDDYSRAIQLEPQNQEAYRHRALAYFRINAYAKALSDRQKLIP